MAIPDLTTYSIEELLQISAMAQQEYTDRKAQEQLDRESEKEAISNAVATLTNLLGDSSETAGTGSIRAIRKYDEATLAANSGLALSLIFEGLEILTMTTLNLANVVGED